MTNLDDWWAEQVRIEEAFLRYTADLPARDDREQVFYRVWAERDAGDPHPESGIDDASYVAYLRRQTPEDLHDLAAETVEAQRENYSPPPNWLGEPEQPASGDAELEAGS
ncbi:MAG: hypothetical protein ACRDNZ_08010 [Streptosporangiaceae bacterium]